MDFEFDKMVRGLGVTKELKDAIGNLGVGVGRHTLKAGIVEEGDSVLYVEELRKGYEIIGRASHIVKYQCTDGYKITCVLAYDNWSDDTGGDAKITSGGVNCDNVTVEITSQPLRGFDFKVTVFGRKI